MQGRKKIEICPIWLEATVKAIQQRRTTIDEASKHARVIINRGKYFPRIVVTQKVSPGTVRRAIDDNGLDLRITRGRQKVDLRQDLKDKIMEIQKMYKTGVNKTFYQIISESDSVPMCQEITHHMIYDVMKENNALSYERPLKPEEPYRCRYEASNPDLIWHTDLHNYNGEYLISFIDDYSRYVVYCDTISNKCSATTKKCLELAIQSCGNRPFSVWTDNGKEFKGDFKKFLEENGIKQVLSKVKNPQQNGKCEKCCVRKFSKNIQFLSKLFKKWIMRDKWSSSER